MGIGLVLLHLPDDIFCFTFLPPQNHLRLCQWPPQLLNIPSANIFKYFQNNNVCKSASSPFYILKLSDKLSKTKIMFFYLIFFAKTNYYRTGYVMTEQWDSLIIPSRFPHSPFPQHSLHLLSSASVH